ncbi:hypothetical protein PHA51_08925 [Rodentibacter pneumotropicus]|uniref:HEAT repeat domain-containing protein n=1 Tax=Rodentibacter pneumotropicus TaxID=758 RepID=A0AAW5LA64_9PAST|nr:MULTISPECIES: hypothetical protein [Rodentibacter]MCQ9120428.1 hypothetical protein [Rodentibacter pneumotropicus]MCQ9122479.1 hypothetical protein [Rodentibacter heylii]MCX2962159.1 hypothetical protein [Rodentibacter heylii]MDC2826147.1 hypothetical protein [Rodentibacter pneumotropicus]
MRIIIETAEEFKMVLDEEMGSPYFPRVEVEDEQIWLDVIEKYPDLEYIVVQYLVSPAVLAKLAYSKDSDVRCMVAEKRRILLETFELLSNDKDYTVRMRVAINAKCPKHILEKLANDKHEEVVDSAMRSLKKRFGG